MSEPVHIVQSTPSVIAGYAAAIGRTLESRGLLAEPIFTRAGVTNASRNDPLERLTSEQVTRLFAICVEATSDPYFGLGVSRHIHASNIHALGYALMASRTLWEFCLRLERYFAIVSQAAVLRIEREDDRVILRFNRITNLCGETEDAFLAFMFRFMRLLLDKPLVPLQVCLMRTCPVAGPEPYIAEFGTLPAFSCAEGLVAFKSALIDEPLGGSCPDLAQFNDRIANDCLAKLKRSDILARTRATIVEGLSSGRCTRAQIARDLGLSQSVLQQRLTERGTSFHELLDETRCELALGYLQQPELSITEIAFLLGFADASNFTRAFKRWNGRAPSAFRPQVSGPGM
ncbi:MAG: AraC family transcriptional regulator [Sphingomonadales bacterium]|nr:AraC family transcriptional regulator [Sphingomonadales bacterium]MDE2570782.1 AraC family transcriptional regulator [Sphingomonadales bacterium]